MVIKAQGLFCDDVRTEADGRFILVGVYPGMIIAGKSDPVTTVSNWIQITGLEPGDHSIELRVEIDSGDETQRFGNSKSRSVRIEGPEPIVITALGLKIESDKSGTIRLFVKIDGEVEIEATQLLYVVVDDADEESEEEALQI